MSQPIITVSGLRGIVGEGLTPEVVIRYVHAFAVDRPPGEILVTRDGRDSGPCLMELTCGALLAAGRDVVIGDVAATPTTGVLVRHLNCAGGIQITASHNPREYNGLKLFADNGRVLSSQEGDQVLKRYRGDDRVWANSKGFGTARCEEDTVTEHLRRIIQIVDSSEIQKKQFKVVLDANHGSGSQLGKLLLEHLGCKVELLGGQPNGQFWHPPEPNEENLADVGKFVLETAADVGFCQDPDADRLAVIDEHGRCVGEEYTLALCADHVLRSHRGPLVVNCTSSRMSEDIARKYDVPYYRTKVGEAHVAEAMVDYDAIFGGEGNGGPIDPRVGLVRDSFVGIALVLDSMVAHGATPSELVDGLPRYTIYKTKFNVDGRFTLSDLETLVENFPEAKADRLDGLRLDWADRWLLVRPSNTEPIVRIVAEANSRDEAERLCESVRKLLQLR